MKKISHKIHKLVVISVALLIYGVANAMVVVSPPVRFELPISRSDAHVDLVNRVKSEMYRFYSSTPNISNEYARENTDPKLQLSVQLDGIRVEDPRWKRGLITAESQDQPDDLLDTLSGDEYDILDSVNIHARVTCLGSGRQVKVKKTNVPVTCAPGEGVEVILYSPHKPGQWGEFSLTEIRQVDDSRASTPTLVPRLNVAEAKKLGADIGLTPPSFNRGMMVGGIGGMGGSGY